MQVTVDVLAVRGDTRVQRATFRGHLEAGAGDVELEIYGVSRIEGLRNAGGALFETRADAEAALAALGEAPEATATRAGDLAGPRAQPVAEARQEREPEARARFADVAAPTGVERHIRTMERAFNTRDFAWLDSSAVDDVVHVDHRAFGAGEVVGLQGELTRLAETIPDVRMHHTTLAVARDDLGLFRLLVTGRSADGGPIEMEVVRVVLVDAEGRVVRSETFEGEAQARARFAELSGGAEGVHGAVPGGDEDRRAGEADPAEHAAP